MTHPFHPLLGQEFALATRRHYWREERVVYFDANGKLRSMAVSWTDQAERDIFQETADGSSWFRFDDLLTLAEKLEMLSQGRSGK